MKKFIFWLLMLCLITPGANAVSSTIKDVYAPRENIIGELTGGILGQIETEKIKVIKNPNLDVAVQYGVGKIGNKNYIWIIAPANTGEYTLIIKDIVAFVNGVPNLVEYRKIFNVTGQQSNFSFSPGIISTNKDFRLVVSAYDYVEVVTDFPEQRMISLYPGINYVDFSISKLLGNQQRIINFGGHQIPVYIVGQKYICGDGRIDDREVCDGLNLNGKNCSSVSERFNAGELKCASSCLVFDTSLCRLETLNPPQQPACSESNLNLCLNQNNCTSAGGFWYNNSCNRFEQGANCGVGRVELCNTFGTCVDAGGFWYNNSCNRNAREECGPTRKDLCLTFGTCVDAGGFWYNNSCNNSSEIVVACGDGIVNGQELCDGLNLSLKNCTALGYDGGNLSCFPKSTENECRFNYSECFLTPPPGPINFSIEPNRIRSIVFVDKGFSNYFFRIKNNGNREITGIKLDYDSSKFLITPLENLSIGLNESIIFNVSVKQNWMGLPFRGTVVAYLEDVYDYVILEFNFTNSESEAITEYRRGSSTTPSFYCSEILGVACAVGSNCDGNIVKTIDQESCCVGTCSKKSDEGSLWWLGYLIIGIVIIVGVIMFMKYKKTGAGGSPLAEKVGMAKKNMP